MKKQAVLAKPTSILALVSDPQRQAELNSALGIYDFRRFDQVEAALEAIYCKYFIPDLVILCLSDDENRRFCELFLADLHLALIPVVLLRAEALPEAEQRQLGITECLSFPETSDQLVAIVQRHEMTRRNWWKSLHVYSAERPEALLQTLGLEKKRSAYLDREGERSAQRCIRSESFHRFRDFLFSRLDYAADRKKYLQNYTSEQVYDLGMALFLDSFQMAGHLADFYGLKNITNLDSYELLIGAIPDQFCRRNLVLPLLDEAGRQCVAIGNPFQLEVLDSIDKLFKQYELLIAPPEMIEEVLNPEFKNTERYRDWQAIRHVRSGIPRDQLNRVRLPLIDEPAQRVLPHNPPPMPRMGNQASFPSRTDMVQAGDHEGYAPEPIRDRPRLQGREHSYSAPLPRGGHQTEDRLSRAYQAYLDQKGDDPVSLSPYASLDSNDRDPEEAPIIHLVNALIEKAHQLGASDVHIEPWEDEVVVRYRIDGTLRVANRLQPQAMIRPIITRLKIMSKLDIAEKRLPQDGQIPFVAYSPGHDINLRVSIVPLAHGEKAVLRILDPKQNIRELEDMGFSALALSQYRQKISSPYGMILHVGPTGSGKTTTLYAALNEINDPEINIQTIENPIEYTLPGINQLEIKHDIGLDFARALRAYLRQDPDVILVGEIRDEETAHVAVEAAMTGHLLFSTLHTNDAASTVIRLLEMGIKPYMISSSILAICAQRLLRRLCTHCRRPYEADMGVKHMLGISGDQKLILYAAGGCEHCNQTGYAGRIGVFELLMPNDSLRAIMNQPHVSAEQIKEAAIRCSGMRTLFQDAIDKTIQGLTSLEELTMQILPDEVSAAKTDAAAKPQSPYPIPRQPQFVKPEFGSIDTSREPGRHVVVY